MTHTCSMSTVSFGLTTSALPKRCTAVTVPVRPAGMPYLWACWR
jgi:hypothetical protein